MAFTSKALCVLEYARTQSNKSTLRAFVKEWPKKQQMQYRSGNGTNRFKSKVACGGSKGLDVHQDRARRETSRGTVFLRNPRKSQRSLEIAPHLIFTNKFCCTRH